MHVRSFASGAIDQMLLQCAECGSLIGIVLCTLLIDRHKRRIGLRKLRRQLWSVDIKKNHHLIGKRYNSNIPFLFLSLEKVSNPHLLLLSGGLWSVIK